MFCIIIENQDGTISIACPNATKRLETETEQEHAARYYSELVIQAPRYVGLPFEIVDHATLPTDRATRDRWRKNPNGSGIVVI